MIIKIQQTTKLLKLNFNKIIKKEKSISPFIMANNRYSVISTFLDNTFDIVLFTTNLISNQQWKLRYTQTSVELKWITSKLNTQCGQLCGVVSHFPSLCHKPHGNVVL